MTAKSKKSRKSGKSTRLISIKRLQEKCEEAWKALILERDGKVCMVQKFFPEINVQHTRTYQADHCFSRKNKHLFLNPANGTMVCSSCNMCKGYGMKSISRAIDDIVIEREGFHVWNSMKDQDLRSKPNENWSKRDWLEQQLKELEFGLQEIKRRREICSDLRDNGIPEPVNSLYDTSDSGTGGDDSSEVCF